MGRITFANVVSDLYSLGVCTIDSVLTLMSVPEEMPDDEQKIAIPLIIEGFQQSAKLSNIRLLYGVTKENPWLMIGGIASTVATRDEFIMPDASQPGNLLVLTKPIGTQVAALVHQHLTNKSEQAKKLCEHIPEEELKKAVAQSHQSMARLNLTGARLMHKYGANGATDVTGFGILGHAQNLASIQKENVDFIINKLPVIRHMMQAAKILPHSRLLLGTSAETSGGLLIILPEDAAKKFCDEIQEIDGETAWIIGKVASGTRKALLGADLETIEYISDKGL